jgi:hypothetical protein
MTVNIRSETWFIGQNGLYNNDNKFLPFQELDSCEALKIVEQCEPVLPPDWGNDIA